MKKPALTLLLALLVSNWLAAQWELHPEQIAPTFYTRSVAWDGKVYFAGGLLNIVDATDRVDILDLSNGMIETRHLSVARGAISCIAHEGKLYFAGGFKFGPGLVPILYDTVDVYDTGSGQWSGYKLSEPRGLGAATVVGGKIMFAGGLTQKNGQIVASDVVDVYDPVSDSCSIMHLWEPKSSFGAVTIGHRAYFPGGLLNESTFPGTTSVDVYDDSLREWSVMHLSAPRGYLGCVAVGKYLIVAGGFSEQLGETNIVEILDTETGNWEEHTMLEPKGFMGAAVLGKKAYFIGGGGLDVPNLFLTPSTSLVEVYDTEDKNWDLQSLELNRMEFASCSWGNKIIVGGGWRPEQFQIIGSIETFTDSSLVSSTPAHAYRPSLTLFPNPVSEHLMVQMADQAHLPPATLNLRVLDQLGRTVKSQPIASIAGETIQVDVSALPEGLYFLELAADHFRRTTRAFWVKR